MNEGNRGEWGEGRRGVCERGRDKVAYYNAREDMTGVCKDITEG